MTTSNSTDANKALVLAGIKGVFIDRDPTVLDRLFSDDYRQHNPQIPNGTAAIKTLLGAGPRISRRRLCGYSRPLSRMGPQAHGGRRYLPYC